ncbi:hypothetical protein [Enterococcus wangshanyuanii]|nr:hypothetical protein [Enterococcus wangshanyuanii]
MDKEFNKKVAGYIDKLKKMEQVTYVEEAPLIKKGKRNIIAKSFIVELDYDQLCLMGSVDVFIYYDGSFGIAKYGIPFGINDLRSLQDVIKFFYGTPFHLNLEKVNNLDIVRYIVSIPEIKVSSFRLLEIYIEQMNISLHEIDKHCHYD